MHLILSMRLNPRCVKKPASKVFVISYTAHVQEQSNQSAVITTKIARSQHLVI